MLRNVKGKMKKMKRTRVGRTDETEMKEEVLIKKIIQEDHLKMRMVGRKRRLRRFECKKC